MTAKTTPRNPLTKSARAVKHCRALCALAGVGFSYDAGLDLYRKLRALEGEAHKLAENFSNGEINTTAEYEELADKVGVKVHELLPKAKHVVINADPRGYALKIKDPPPELEQDWGKTGILAPDFKQ